MLSLKFRPSMDYFPTVSTFMLIDLYVSIDYLKSYFSDKYSIMKMIWLLGGTHPVRTIDLE